MANIMQALNWKTMDAKKLSKLIQMSVLACEVTKVTINCESHCKNEGKMQRYMVAMREKSKECRLHRNTFRKHDNHGKECLALATHMPDP